MSPRRLPLSNSWPVRRVASGAAAPVAPLPLVEAPPAAGAAIGAAAPVPGERPLSVTALLNRVKSALTEAFPRGVAVVGQISGMKAHSSGHLYFRLKDSACSVDAVMFRASAMRLKFEPVDGLEVVAEGRVDVYESRGQLQLYVERLTPKGAGALELAFRQLVEKLQKEGLFDPSRKVPLPRVPRAVGVITSRTGAAVRDIARTLARRWPAAKVCLAPVLVQGEGAAGEIAEAIRLMDASAGRYEIDTIILARGGGSAEDLWAFNEEAVARAIAACRTPIICGVGHEVDVTVADMVADVRAPTPTGAAELAVPDRRDMDRLVRELAGRLARRLGECLRQARAELAGVMRSAVFRDPLHRVRSRTQELDDVVGRLRLALAGRAKALHDRLEPAAGRLAAMHPARLREQAAARLRGLTHRLAWALGGRSKRAGDALAERAGRLHAATPANRLRLVRQQVSACERQLEAMSYRGVLKRGFSLTRGPRGRLIRSVHDAQTGDAILTEVADGSIESVVGEANVPAGRDSPRPQAQTRRPPRKGRPTQDGPSLFE
jgi:exodeoxyribonuclease VII large subunit